MKKLFTFLLILIGFMVHAQDNKPTKEETIEYINNFLESQEDNELSCEIYRKRYDAIFSTKIIHRQGKLLTSSSGKFVLLTTVCGRETDWLGKEVITISHKVYLHEIEEIQIAGLGNIDDDGTGGCSQYGLYFKKKGGQDFNVDSGFLPLWKGVTGEDTNKYKETQIYKAFEHLRKLCGAPEPLKF
jgi:hypothetical protein